MCTMAAAVIPYPVCIYVISYTIVWEILDIKKISLLVRHDEN